MAAVLLPHRFMLLKFSCIALFCFALTAAKSVLLIQKSVSLSGMQVFPAEEEDGEETAT